MLLFIYKLQFDSCSLCMDNESMPSPQTLSKNKTLSHLKPSQYPRFSKHPDQTSNTSRQNESDPSNGKNDEKKKRGFL